MHVAVFFWFILVYSHVGPVKQTHFLEEEQDTVAEKSWLTMSPVDEAPVALVT